MTNASRFTKICLVRLEIVLLPELANGAWVEISSPYVGCEKKEIDESEKYASGR